MVRASSPATSVPSDAAISDARDSRKSPARIACRLPHLAFTVSTPRRVSASSMTSSWYSEPGAPVRTRHRPGRTSSEARSPSTCAPATASTGRRRLPPATMRWEAISLRYGSGVTTASCIADSMRRRSRSIDARVNSGDVRFAACTSSGDTSHRLGALGGGHTNVRTTGRTSPDAVSCEPCPSRRPFPPSCRRPTRPAGAEAAGSTSAATRSWRAACCRDS